MSMSAQHFWSLPKQHGPNSTLPENSRQPRSTAWHPYPEKPSKRSCELWHAVHDLPDFEANLAQLQETITHVEKFIPENRINDFIRSQEESEVVTEFRRANPDKEAELRPA
ncbi:hypothetical protein FOXG_19099 [Fusarium oxysporum f. sp. lycopersici 4287]|uniref:Uncharacterized protein n=2 Tax=Fusarium oxysporum TaxID=5507 RepID=A0A0J9UU72_FUSO4|nr:hypothetical protein FOXG_19099 [Fusarium oxysporum f. sp. lycopersici 4287]EXK32650.1 hypothetical protein FOMG_11533 [Fusarium oxysporum f. sp. melonis 26406]KAJ9422884.1 hypothetical protein QL093DRAFT_2096822 [Fusarium oxysporum]KNB03079.1 hypothetical protein FOXG_19099 [Fusarium oxysporum f. sp. lycopersici 4287]